ncbi:MAG TPA: coniferyl-alcohol dehydrogenase [Acidimicrobiia bacterium]|nr:coniferyl-alcohol dehydrogenase [Acidimicrobiia bacterium]
MVGVLQYDGKRVIVTGAASGMGAATAELLVELGAEVHAVDIKKPAVGGLASFSECDLRDPEQIDATVAKIGHVVNALFNCAGLPNTFPNLDVMFVNFCGLRHVTEAVIPHMIEGSAIASIASTAGIGWMANMELLFGLLATPDFAAARGWCEEHPSDLENAYGLSKEAINAYTAFRSFTLARAGIRINCVNPGPTDTPMMPEFEKAVGKKYMDEFPVPMGRHAVAEEQAWPLLFLNSPRASFVTGAQLDCDGGFKGGLFTGQIDAKVLMPEGVAETRG